MTVVTTLKDSVPAIDFVGISSVDLSSPRVLRHVQFVMPSQLHSQENRSSSQLQSNVPLVHQRGFKSRSRCCTHIVRWSAVWVMLAAFGCVLAIASFALSYVHHSDKMRNETAPFVDPMLYSEDLAINTVNSSELCVTQCPPATSRFFAICPCAAQHCHCPFVSPGFIVPNACMVLCFNSSLPIPVNCNNVTSILCGGA